MVRYMKPLMERIQNGDIDPSFIISHRSTNLEDSPALYDMFRDKKKWRCSGRIGIPRSLRRDR
jgi:threonine dehydrogenase-like Zn-dependent dehydrogenase